MALGRGQSQGLVQESSGQGCCLAAPSKDASSRQQARMDQLLKSEEAGSQVHIEGKDEGAERATQPMGRGS
eukprot:2075690-Pyramimonas_sp.AAC.1